MTPEVNASVISPASSTPRKAFWAAVLRFEKSKLIPAIALRNTIGVALPVAAGVATGHPLAGLGIATGALNVAYSDGQDAYRTRARRMLASTLLGAVAVFVGSALCRNALTAIIVVSLWGFAAGMLVALGAVADIGVITLVMVIVFAARPVSFNDAAATSALVLIGGLFQTALALVFWAVRPYSPERRALGQLYSDLSKTASQPVDTTLAPPVTSSVTAAQNTLSARANDYSIEAARYRSLLNQAERSRLALLTVARLRKRMEREPGAKQCIETIDRFLQLSSLTLEAMGEMLLGADFSAVSHQWLRELEDVAEQMRERGRNGSSAFFAAMVEDTRYQMDALAGQLRAATDLASHATPAGLEEFARREARKPWMLQITGPLATLRANLHLGSTACRHALRLAVCLAVAEGIERAFDWRRSYWLPMTVAIVLKPDFTGTFSRGVLRLAGTLSGLLLATALFHFYPTAAVWHTILVALLTFILRWLGPANYGVFVTAVSALIVLMVAMTGVSPKEVILARGLNTTVGGILALVGYWVWPTWERTRVSEIMAKMLEAYREYYQVISNAYLNPDAPLQPELEKKRMSARLARSNVEASVDRLSAEPGNTPRQLDELTAMLASSHRLIYAFMSLEAGLSASRPAKPRDEFRVFARDVDTTLYLLAAHLRGSALTANELPDLREDHHRLVQAGKNAVERYELVNVEADRITNSLNTLREQILRWTRVHNRSRR
jgi:uncharacterized membrane protein YccC